MMNALKPILLSLTLSAMMITLPAQGQMEQRNQRIEQIKSALMQIEQATADTQIQIVPHLQYLESNRVQLQQTLMTIGQIERDLYQTDANLRQRQFELGQNCPLNGYGQPMCPPNIFNSLASSIQQLQARLQQLFQLRQQRINDHQSLLATTIQAVNLIRALEQNAQSFFALRNELAQELAQLSQVNTTAPVGFNFGTGEVSNIKPPAELPADTRDLIEKAKTSLVKVDDQLNRAKETSESAESILGETTQTLANIKKTLAGTPANELDFGDL